jgi:pyridoxal phosphate enzyme (YggS family)
MSEALRDRAERGLRETRVAIAAACERVGRAPSSVRLIAVSKKQPLEAISAAYDLGQREFGENYVQELLRRIEKLGELPGLSIRLIGPLQRNKAKQLARLGVPVDTLDSLALAQELAKRAREHERALEVMLQVNVDREPQKAGVLPEAAIELAEQVRALPGLTLAGVLAIPAQRDDAEAMRPAFRALRELGERIGVRELSMGMSDDFEVAIEEGATVVRVGTALFGPRGA